MSSHKDNRAKETLEILLECNAVLKDDHFVYVSGDHGSGWINKDVIFPDPKRVRRLSELLADAIVDIEFDVICGPATGGLILSQSIASILGVTSVFAEHDPSWKKDSDGGLRAPFILKRGYDKLVSNRRVIVVDDIVNVGFSVLSTANAVSRAGGEVVAVATLVNRGNIDTSKLETNELIYLLEYDIPAWPESKCELCRDGIPINTEYGHGQDFLLKKKKFGHRLLFNLELFSRELSNKII